MKLVIQRVKSAEVKIDEKIFSSIEKGLLIFIGIADTDTGTEIDWLTKKVCEMRIFEDEFGKMNLSVKDMQYEVLLVSQFTLHADCRKGRRPDFIRAAKPQIAEKLYLQFAEELTKKGIKPQLGKFAAHMNVSLVNDGPVTIILEK